MNLKVNTKKILLICMSSTLLFSSFETTIYAKEIPVYEEEKKEGDVIIYFETLKEEIEEEISEENLEKVEKKVAQFILFLSDEEEYAGYTWSELTDEAKKKVLELFIELDQTVTLKYPDYVENMKEYSSKASDFIKNTYSEIKELGSDYIEENIDKEVRKDVKESVQEGIEDMKESVRWIKQKAQDWARKKSGK